MNFISASGTSSLSCKHERCFYVSHQICQALFRDQCGTLVNTAARLKFSYGRLIYLKEWPKFFAAVRVLSVVSIPVGFALNKAYCLFFSLVPVNRPAPPIHHH